MYKIKSVGKFYIKDRGWVFTCKSPVDGERTHEGMSKAVGDKIEIDGKIYKPLAFEMFQPGYPVYVGEPIGILIEGDINE